MGIFELVILVIGIMFILVFSLLMIAAVYACILTAKEGQERLEKRFYEERGYKPSKKQLLDYELEQEGK